MPQGVPTTVPDDGLTTAQRRNRPLLMVHTGPGKGKSTAAFGLAMRGWNQGFSIGVFQFVKSAKWRIGEQTVLERLGALHEETGEGGPVAWHKMGSGWSWSRKAGSEEDHAADAREGWEEIKRRLAAETHTVYILDEFTYVMKWGWVELDEPDADPDADRHRDLTEAEAAGRHADDAACEAHHGDDLAARAFEKVRELGERRPERRVGAGDGGARAEQRGDGGDGVVACPAESGTVHRELGGSH